MEKSLREFLINELRIADGIENPTEEQIQEKLVWYNEYRARKIRKFEAEQQYKATLSEGLELEVTDWDYETKTMKFFCDDKKAVDLVMMYVLNTLDIEEPIYTLTMDGILKVSFGEYKRIAVEIGRHLYNVRKIYYKQLLGIENGF
jgi:hypothetical protein